MYYSSANAYYAYNIKYYDIFANMRPIFRKLRENTPRI